MNVQIATPKGYEADSDVIATGHELAVANKVKLTIGNDPRKAVAGADVVVTDTWVSMGQESEAMQKKKDFAGYQVNNTVSRIDVVGAM